MGVVSRCNVGVVCQCILSVKCVGVVCWSSESV